MSVAFLALTSTVASAQVCIVGILAAAIYASAHDHRELTPKEAATCGLAYGSETNKPETKKKEKAARRAKAKKHAKPAN
jgi:hypothetical protein